MKSFLSKVISACLLLSISFGVSSCSSILKEKKVYIEKGYKKEIGVYRVDIFDYKNGAIYASATSFAYEYNKAEGKTYFFTNDHVCQAIINDTTVLLLTGVVVEKEFMAYGNLEASSWGSEICIFSAKTKMEHLKIKDQDYIPKEGESIKVIGAPYGIFPTTSIGYIEDPLYDRFKAAPLSIDIIFGMPFLSVKAEIHPGSSGSPVLSKSGEVIGMIFAGDGQGNGIAVSHIDLIAAKEMFKMQKERLKEKEVE